MKLSRNNIYIENSNSDIIVANTYTRSIISLKVDFMQELKSNQYKLIDKDVINRLFHLGIIVPDDLNENKFLEYLFYRQQLSDKCLVTYLMYSTDCNFACEYCYEMGHSQRRTMSLEKYNELVEWYKQKIIHGGISECQIVLFGGEPLLYTSVFLKLLSTIKNVAESNNVVLSTKIITNGFFLDEDFVTSMKDFNLKEIQVTIDGTPRNHDKLRHLKNGAGTFDKVFSNLLATSSQSADSGITFLCRINFSKQNLDQIPQFLELLNQKDPKHYITPYFAHVTQTYSQISNISSFCSNNVYSDDVELANNYVELWRKAKEVGYSVPPFYTLGPCMYFSANGYVITPSGDLYKCLNMVDVKEHICGNIANPVHNNNHYYDTILSSQLSYCLNTDCPYVPICSNGCILESWLKHGNTQTVCCKRDFMDIVNRGLISMKFNNKKEK